MKTTWNRFVLVMALATAPVLAQAEEAAGDDAKAPQMTAEMQAMMAAWQKASTPGAQQAQLVEHFAGNWTARQSMWMDPAGEPSVAVGKASTQALYGNRTVRMDFRSEAMGQPLEGTGYTGYDNTLGRYYSAWVDSMGTGMMLAYGDYDAATRTYTFRAEMPDPMRPGAHTPIRNVIRIVDADHHVFEMHETHDGKEARTMQIEYTRDAR